jgi:hypothetical protein
MTIVESLSCTWTNVDELDIKLRDMATRKTLYRVVVNINDPKKVADALMILEKYGVNIEQVYNIMQERKKQKINWWL